jgi:hypothetical protein
MSSTIPSPHANRFVTGTAVINARTFIQVNLALSKFTGSFLKPPGSFLDPPGSFLNPPGSFLGYPSIPQLRWGTPVSWGGISLEIEQLQEKIAALKQKLGSEGVKEADLEGCVHFSRGGERGRVQGNGYLTSAGRDGEGLLPSANFRPKDAEDEVSALVGKVLDMRTPPATQERKLVVDLFPPTSGSDLRVLTTADTVLHCPHVPPCPQCCKERVCCLLVLDSVTSTPRWIRQPEAAWCTIVSRGR